MDLVEIERSDHASDAELTPESGWETLYVDGEWRQPRDRDLIAVENPATGETIARVPAATTDDVDAAFEAAAAAQVEWANSLPQERTQIIARVGQLLGEYSEDLIRLIAIEAGGVRLKGEVEVEVTRGMIDVSGGLPFEASGEQHDSVIPGRENLVVREPVGVVGVITPWNYPLNLAMRAVIPALALGNAVVLKPDEHTPITGGLAIAKLLEEAGVPPGLFNVVPGRGSEIGDHFSSHPVPSVVSFTGSTAVGRRVARNAAEQLHLPQLELGGNCPHVVTERADLDLAVDAAMLGTFINQGQGCISINRHLVHESLYDEYVEQLARRAAELPMGDPRDPDVIIGPISYEAQHAKVADFLERTIEEGATVETGGNAEWPYIEPTVLSGVTNDMTASCNEHFGPIAPVIPFETDEEAVELANDTEYGLAASVHSRDLGHAREVADRIDAGMVHINDQPTNDEPHMPFGGAKASGLGRFNDRWVMEEYTEPKWISVQREDRDYPL